MRRTQRVKSFDVVAATTGAVMPHALGMREIPVDQITGSVGRANELRADFRPVRRNGSALRQGRYRQIEQAMARDVLLPPIAVYRIGTEYFVVDGHHRVAAARSLGQLYIDALVTDYVPADDGAGERAMLDRHAFERRTRLQEIILTNPMHYRSLLNQVEEHRWALSQERARPVDLPEAAYDWRARISAPVIRMIEEAGLARHFRDATPADLYAYVSDHKWFSSQRLRHDVGFAWAVTDFARQCRLTGSGRGTVWNRWWQSLVAHLVRVKAELGRAAGALLATLSTSYGDSAESGHRLT